MDFLSPSPALDARLTLRDVAPAIIALWCRGDGGGVPAGLAYGECCCWCKSAASAKAANSVRDAARDWLALVTLPSLRGVANAGIGELCGAGEDAAVASSALGESTRLGGCPIEPVLSAGVI